MNLVLRPLAAEDLLQQQNYLWQNASPAIADRFLIAADETLNDLLLHPHIGFPIQSDMLTGLRAWPVKGFKNARIFYLVRGDLLRIVRVLHAKQDAPVLLHEDEN